MLKRKVKIIYNEDDYTYKKGDFFECMIADIFSSQHYDISERTNFTGMEIDLIA
jgi:hypothetical protein